MEDMDGIMESGATAAGSRRNQAAVSRATQALLAAQRQVGISSSS
jgi:hypothetical protein